MKFYSNRPSIPDAADYQNMVRSIFDSGFLTNFGQCHNELLRKLKIVFKTENLALGNNATTALACVIRALTDKQNQGYHNPIHILSYLPFNCLG
jgi:dTDP-4-amino-4,6-dideoxygalactose transaminase